MNRAIVAGSLAQRPYHGGHAWVFLQYVLGLRRLGWDVLFLDRLDPAMYIGDDYGPTSVERSANVRYLSRMMERFGLANSYAVFYDTGLSTFGRSRGDVLAHARDSAFLLNVMGFLNDEEILECVDQRIFLDIDPGFGQMWAALGLHDMFKDHDRYVTIGLNIESPGCSIPTCGIDWATTNQPVVLEQWPAQAPGGNAITSIGSWRGPFAPVEWQGGTYGLRVHEFRKFLELPARTQERFELALDIHESDAKDLDALAKNGWVLVDPRHVAGDPDGYREFIHRSKAEFMVAKNMYVQTKSGWFSDRSICYLASGKPVVAQGTGFSSSLPSEAGLLAFSTLDEAVSRVEQLNEAYDDHARAARALAEEYFDSDVVLPRLLGKLGIG